MSMVKRTKNVDSRKMVIGVLFLPRKEKIIKRILE